MLDTIEAPPKHSYKPKRNRQLHTESDQDEEEEEEEEEEDVEKESKEPEHEEPVPPRQRRRRRRRRQHHRQRSPFSSDPHVRIAMYIAMAHAGLALSLALLFGVTKLLQGYWRPIQWAILCSMPLRELQTALVSFWSHSLNLGLFQTIIAIPIAALRATTSSLIDSHAAFLRLLGHSPSTHQRKTKIGFYKLMQWLTSFGLFVIAYERIGLASIPALVIPCSIRVIINQHVRNTLSAISFSRRGNRNFKNYNSLGQKLCRYITSLMLRRLKTVVGLGLILHMLIGSAFGIVFFSYKIVIEGKDAVVSLETHLEENNYAERIGLKKWMDDNQIPELFYAHATKFYETISQDVDSLASYYNVTEIVDSIRDYMTRPLQGSVFSSVPEKVSFQPLSQKIHNIQSRVKNKEWKLIYGEFMSLIAREDLMGKIKAFVLQSLDVSKQVLASGTMVLVGGANLLIFMAVSIVYGAAGLLNFISELMVFLWLLYYLITSESGGVMEHVLGMLPLSRSTRVQCAHVLDHAISSVLLAAAKVTLFQGCVTYLLFRLYHIHFLYTSTFLALMSAVLPITPAAWLPSIPAAAQLAMEARYIEAIMLTAIHQILLDYGTTAIQDEIPGHSAYLTGLSILGGIALFPSILEGAIMGPLLMTVMIALKNLYVEFVLTSVDETETSQ